MTCPHESSKLQVVKINSHYDQPIIVDQCTNCGGIWFDADELWSVKSGEAKKIDVINTQTLRSSSVITNAIMHCPKDQTELKQFHDKNFPTELIIEQCPACNGLWLQRGEFQQYQEHRDKPKKEIVISDKDKKFNEQIDKILALYSQQPTIDAINRRTSALSAVLLEHQAQTIFPPLHSVHRPFVELRSYHPVFEVLYQVFNLFSQ
jgi:Zn-finger nucleic acid-binding protein